MRSVEKNKNLKHPKMVNVSDLRPSPGKLIVTVLLIRPTLRSSLPLLRQSKSELQKGENLQNLDKRKPRARRFPAPGNTAESGTPKYYRKRVHIE